MTMQWSFDENRSAMRWTDMTGKPDQPSDANESEMNGSYLAPLLDFASLMAIGRELDHGDPGQLEPR